MFKMRTNSASKDDCFKVATLTSEVGDRIAVRNTSNFLIKDRSFIKFFGDVVSGRADDFDATIVGLSVWVRSDDCRNC